MNKYLQTLKTKLFFKQSKNSNIAMFVGLFYNTLFHMEMDYAIDL